MWNLKNKKIIFIICAVIIVVALIGTILYYQLNKQTVVETVGASSKNLNLEEEVILEVKEEVVSVAVDNSEEESLIEENKEEEEVVFKDKKVTVPKSTVAPVNSAEDAESGKKNGGQSINQDQANQMFQNEGVTSRGIDVSAHQGKINWAQVAASGVDFAIIRAGFRGQTAGAIYEDAYFKTNVAGATANGIKVGIYFYSTAVNENEALEEAAWVVKKISTYRITYPVVYDFEDFGAYRCKNVGGAQATSNALTFLSFVQSNGYEPMMYANKSDITNKLSRGAFQMKFWLAHYTTQTDYAGNYQMWQYTSKGSVPGISGNVDMNIAYFSYGTTAAPKHTHNYSEEVKNSYKAPTCTQVGTRVVRCSCGDSHSEEIPMVAHKFGVWKVQTPATTEKEGVQVRICSVCQKQETKTIEKLKPNNNTENTNNNTSENTNTTVPHNHSYVEDPTLSIQATCAKEGKKVEICTVCGDKIETSISKTENHSFGDWVVITPATTTEEGLKERSCSLCNKKETSKIDKLVETENTNTQNEIQ